MWPGFRGLRKRNWEVIGTISPHTSLVSAPPHSCSELLSCSTVFSASAWRNPSCSHLLWGSPATQKEWLSSSTLILNYQRRISDWPDEWRAHLLSVTGRGANMAVRSPPPLQFLKQRGWAKNPGGTPYSLCELVLYLKHLIDPLSLEPPHPSQAASLVNAQAFSAQE